MDENAAIKNKQRTNDVLDIEYLKETGFNTLQRIAGKTWTDFNPHDPGITILENLCYALTELGYRTKYNVRDILARIKHDEEHLHPDTLYEAPEILSAIPISIRDYRKILLDIDGVKNAMIMPSSQLADCKGTYSIALELYPEYDDDFNRRIIRHEVHLELNMNRNLCEDFAAVDFVEYDSLGFDIDVEISGNIKAEDIYIQIFSALEEYLSPGIRFCSLYEMVEKGYAVEQIFDGPLLKNGFIPDAEIERLDFKKEICISDILHLLMDIEGVDYVHKIRMLDEEMQEHRWTYTVKPGKAPKMDSDRTQLRLFNLSSQVLIENEELIKTRRNHLRETFGSRHKRLRFAKEYGRYRQLEKYYPISNDFPEIFGIGAAGLPPSASDERKAQAKQLKAYLLFFEQVLANYFSQLENLKELFSLKDISQTYFAQPLFNLPGIEYLYQPFLAHCFRQSININDPYQMKREWQDYKEDEQNEIGRLLRNIMESEEVFYDRRNRILDHLLARFALDFRNYGFITYQGTHDDNYKQFIHEKLNILKDITRISKERGKGFNNILADILSDKDNVSGFERRLNKLLSVENNSKHFLTSGILEKIIVKENSPVTQHLDISEETQEPFALFHFSQTGKPDAIRLLFQHGLEKRNYRIVRDTDEGPYILQLCDNKGNPVGRNDRQFGDSMQAESEIDRIVEQLEMLDKTSQSITILEHIFLQPDKGMPCHGFSWKDEEGNDLFRHEPSLTYADRAALVDLLSSAGKEQTSYKVMPAGNGHTKIHICADDNTSLISGVRYYSKNDDTETEIAGMLRLFQTYRANQSNIQYYTKYSELMGDAEDPFSFIVTVVMPDWPRKFQDKRFRAHAERVIRREIPAHLYPNIKWFDYYAMQQFQQLHQDLLTEKRKKQPQLEKLSALTDALLMMLF